MIVKVAPYRWSLDPATVDRFADVQARPDRQALYRKVKDKLHYSTMRWRKSQIFYTLLGGGTASPNAARQVQTVLDNIKKEPPSGRRVPNAVLRKIESVSNGATRKTMHRHFETSIDYYQERDPADFPDMVPSYTGTSYGGGEVLVPVYRKMNRVRFIEATTRGRPGTVTAAEQRAIQQWADELQPVQWPGLTMGYLPPVEELERCGQCIGMGRMSWRGSWFGDAENELMRMLFWKLPELGAYLEANGIKPGVLNLVYKTARNRPMAKTHLIKPSRKFAGRLAVIAVMLANCLVPPEKRYEGHLWSVNRLLVLDARRWMAVQYDWKPQPPAAAGHHVWHMLEQDHEIVQGWVSRPITYPAAYNCDPVQLWPVLEQSAWFWTAFVNVINGRGWGDSQAARYIRGEL